MNLPFEASAPAVTNRRRWAIVHLLFIASLINYLDRATLSVALPAISLELHLDPLTKGRLLSAFFWSYALMQIPIGMLADRVNLRWLYAASFALWSFSCGLTGVAGSLGVLIALRISLGVGESIYLPGGSKIVSVLFPPAERGLPAGLFDCGTRAGLALGAPAIAALTVAFGWRKMFMLVGFFALAWLVPWLLVFPKRLPQRARAKPHTAVRPLTALKALASNRNLVGICLGFLCFDYYWYLLVTWLPDYLVTVRHLTLFKAGLYSALPYFVFGAGEPIGGWIADHLIRRGWDETRTRKGIVAVAYLTGLFLLPAARVESPRTTILLISGGCLVGLATGNMLVILQSCAPAEDIGLWTGMENFFGNIGGVFAPLLMGFLIESTRSYRPGFALAVIVLLVGLLAYCFVVGRLKSPEITNS
jgi:MFS transporter, ACS family, D-galactonate transporter